jgi:hypothetical protein
MGVGGQKRLKMGGMWLKMGVGGRKRSKIGGRLWYVVENGCRWLKTVENDRTFYGNRRGTRAVQGFKLRFTGLYNAGFPFLYRSVTGLQVELSTFF